MGKMGNKGWLYLKIVKLLEKTPMTEKDLFEEFDKTPSLFCRNGLDERGLNNRLEILLNIDVVAKDELGAYHLVKDYYQHLSLLKVLKNSKLYLQLISGK